LALAACAYGYTGAPGGQDGLPSARDLGYNRRKGLSGLKLDLEITPKEVKRRLDSGEALLLLDVREPLEYATSSLSSAELIPMNTVPGRLREIERFAGNRLVVVYCHHGTRSLSVVHWLREQGVENCQSMEGGIERWSIEIDPNVPRY
jgi:rhodanese-related sulfurtransferase